MAKIHCLNKISPLGISALGEGYELTDSLADADAVLVRSASMHEMELPSRLLAVARAGAGVNNIPLDRCAEQGIVVFNTPGANANAVKELVIAGLFLSSRDIVAGATWVQQEKADPAINKTVEKKKSQFGGVEIMGKKLGVIGLGAIGVKVANAALALGMEVYGCDPYLTLTNAWNVSSGVKLVKTQEEIFKICDYITVHVPLLDETRGMINKDTIAMMKDGVVVLNFARDLLVNDDDMAEALASGKVHRYVTDFPNAKSANMAGCIAIPHLGASTEEAEDNCAVMAAKQVKDYLENGSITNSVNFPACDAGICRNDLRISVLYRNESDTLTAITDALCGLSLQVVRTVSNARGVYGAAVIDCDGSADGDVVSEKLKVVGALRARVL